MNRSLINSTVALRSIQQQFDVVAHNTANVNTNGFKRKEASFSDVLTAVQQQPGVLQQQVGRMTPGGLNQGAGVRLGMIQADLSQGTLKETGHPLDIAIEGYGLFEVVVPTADERGLASNEVRWTRDGAFQLSFDSQNPDSLMLTTKDGFFVRGINDEPLRIPAHHRMQVASDGTVLAFDERNPEALPIEVGQLKLVQLLQPNAMELVGDNLYRMPTNSGMTLAEAVQTVDQDVQSSLGHTVNIRQGFLEQSNVNLTDEMTNLIMLQRAYQLNSRALQSTDAMMNIANNLRG